MDISRKTDYALRMLELLVHNEGGLLSVRTAAEEVDVPYSFARSIQHGLAHAGIIESLRGVHGGMRMKADPEEITLLQVVEAVQGPLVMNDCTAEGGSCSRLGSCKLHFVWAGAQVLLRDYLSSITLAEAVSGSVHPAVSECFTDRTAFESYARCDKIGNRK